MYMYMCLLTEVWPQSMEREIDQISLYVSNFPKKVRKKADSI